MLDERVVKFLIGLLLMVVAVFCWLAFTFYRDANRVDNFCNTYPASCHYDYWKDANNE